MSETVGEWFDNPHPVDGWVPVGPVVYIPIPPEGQAMTTITPEAVDAAHAAVPYVRSGDLMTALTAALPHTEAAIRADERAKTAAGIAEMIRARANAALNRDERLAGLVDADYCRLYAERSTL